MALSRQQRIFNFVARYVQKPALALTRPQWLARRVFDLNALVMVKRPAGLRRRDEVLGPESSAVPVSWLNLGGETGNGVVLYLHGGAFVIGSIRGYVQVLAPLADAVGMAGCFVHYRMAPEHPFPAASDDALIAYRGLLENGFEPSRIVLAGDSAGGNLVFSLLHRIGVEGLAMPGAVVAMSPIVDLSLSSPSLQTNQASDMLVPVSWGSRGVRDYLQGADPADPVASPLNGSFKGAPPVMFQVVASEVLYDDTRRMAEALRAQGVTVRVDEWENVPHVWHLNAGRSPEADRGIADLAGFLRDTLALD